MSGARRVIVRFIPPHPGEPEERGEDGFSLQRIAAGVRLSALAFAPICIETARNFELRDPA